MAVVAPEADEGEVRRLVEGVRGQGCRASVYDVGPGVVLLAGVRPRHLESLIGENRAIERVFIPDTRYRLVRREVSPGGSRVAIGPTVFGGDTFVVVAGPCAVESRGQLLDTARAVADAGAAVLRGGAFKPRTSPYNFPGLGLRGIDLLAEARQGSGLPFVTEVMDPGLIEAMYPLVDAFQVGARNMQNFDLLRALGDVDKPVLLKRGPSATVEEWLLAAEYILVGGNDQVILCERGIRTFNTTTRYTLDLASVALAKRETHLPVIVDPSHATGDPSLVHPMACAALAAGADGVIVEVHAHPDEALSDGHQSLTPSAFARAMEQLAALAPGMGKSLAPSPAGAGRVAS
ncbi:MAG: 3-deoxy-7-phosphoheptulonate synthase [Anaerolineae bacterium]